MFEKNNFLLTLLEQSPSWLDAEIKLLRVEDKRKGITETDVGSESTTIEIDADILIPDEPSDFVATKKAKPSKSAPSSEKIAKESTNVPTKENPASDQDEDLYRYPDIDKVSAKLTKEKIIADPIDPERLLGGNNEEEFTLDKLRGLKIDGEQPGAEILALQKLSRTLQESNVRPDLKPVFYPNQASYAVLAEATALLEEACYHYVARTTPSVVKWPTYDCPEAQEYKRWVDLIVRLAKEYKTSGLGLPPKFMEGITYGGLIRNAAAHRLPINAPKLRELLSRSKKWMDLLKVPEVSAKFERLQGSAMEMQDELERALEPVVGEVMGSLERIKENWAHVRKLETRIKEINRSIAKEMSSIDKEELNMKAIIEKSQMIRSERGQKFEREMLRVYVHNLEPPVEPKVVEESESSTAPTDADALRATDKMTPEVKAITEPKAGDKDPLAENSEVKAATVTELSAEEVESILAAEEARFNRLDRKKLRGSDKDGLISFSENTLKHIEEVTSPQEDSNRDLQDFIMENAINSTAETKTDTKYGTMPKEVQGKPETPSGIILFLGSDEESTALTSMTPTNVATISKNFFQFYIDLYGV
ncbi:hypothetical protein ABW20_dc0105181 [Dactylellina cionopaga]|nr:hypothetical protein ABW20_dc0105181 [Dactylellina cionopaga]